MLYSGVVKFFGLEQIRVIAEALSVEKVDFVALAVSLP